MTAEDLLSPALLRLVRALWPLLGGPATHGPALDEVVVRLALYRHQVGPLLFGAVHQGSVTVFPALREELCASYQSSVLRHANQGARLERIEEIFAARKIAWLSLKGSQQAAQLYPDRAWRTSSDIDLLVAPRAFASAVEALAANGYIASNPPMPKRAWLRGLVLRAVRDVSLIADDDHVCAVDLHSRLFLAVGRRAALQLIPRPAHAPALDAALACYLIMHGAQGFWVRLKWLVDLVPLFAKLSDAEKAAIPTLARRVGAEHSVLASLCLLRMLFPFVALGPLQAWLSRSENHPAVQRRLQRYVMMISTTRDWRHSPLDNAWMTMAAWLSLFERPLTRIRMIPAALFSSVMRRLAGALLPDARALTRCDVPPPR